MPVSSLIVGRIVDFDVDADCALLELLTMRAIRGRRCIECRGCGAWRCDCGG